MIATAALLAAFAVTQGPAPPPPGLSLVLSCGDTASELTLAIHNPDQADTAVLLGIALANGRWHMPRALVVEIRRGGSSDVEELVYSGPTGIAGRIDHWVVALPARATFTLILHAADFISTSPAPGVSPPEELSVRLTGRLITSELNVDMPGMQAWRLWTGETRSNVLRLSNCP